LDGLAEMCREGEIFMDDACEHICVAIDQLLLP
jgi:hypothetical protein